MTTQPQPQPPVQPADPLDAAMTPQPISLERTYFGEIYLVDAAFYVLKKGQQKRLWDATHDPISDRRTAIKLGLQPLRGQYTVEQEVFDFSKEWQAVTLPSLRHHNLDLRSVKGKFVQLKRTLTGESYLSRSTGERKEKTAFQIVAVYADRDACQAAADAFYQRADDDTPAPSPPAPAPVASPDRTTAAAFLPLLWNASNQHADTFWQQIQDNPLLAPHFPTRYEPEIVALTNEVPF